MKSAIVLAKCNFNHSWFVDNLNHIPDHIPGHLICTSEAQGALEQVLNNVTTQDHHKPPLQFSLNFRRKQVTKKKLISRTVLALALAAIKFDTWPWVKEFTM